MWTWVDWLGLALFDAALSTTAFLGLILFPLLACRQPVRRILAVRVALAASIVTIPLVASTAWPRFDLIRFVEDHVAQAASAAPESAGGAEFGPEEQIAVPPAATRIAAVIDFVARRRPVLLRVGSLIYLLGVGAGCGWLALGYWGVRRLVRQSTTPSTAARAVYNQILEARGAWGSAPDLRSSAGVARPVLVGLRKPTILLPSHLDNADGGGDRLRLCLLHELSHFERGDHLHGLIASLAQVLWFFVPPLWWLRSRLLIDQEFVADRAAAHEFGNESTYAASLLAVAELGVDRVAKAQSVEPGGSSATPDHRGGTPLLDRMLVLLHCPYRLETAPPRAWSWRLYLLIITLSLAATVVRLRWPEHVLPDHQLPGTRSTRAHSFRVAEFSAAPLPHPSNGRSLPYVLPVTLPESFRLELQIKVDSAELNHLRIAGHLLSPDVHGYDRPSSESQDYPPARRWHTIEIERHGAEVAIHLDGLVFWSDNKTKTTPWLTIEPCSPTPIRFRSLLLTW